MNLSNEIPISAVFAVQPEHSVKHYTGPKELMVVGLLANVGIGIVLLFLSSSLATGLLVLIGAGS